MRAPSRVLRTALLLVLLAVGMTACSQEERAREEVLEAIDETRLQPFRFVYTQQDPDGSEQVQGLVEDDFRYKARLTRGSAHLFDEVVSDDAIAVRFAEPDAIGNFVDDTQRDLADLDTELEGITVIEALQARRWVLDPVGAPALTGAARSVESLGEDPVFDALGVFDYVERAMDQAANVEEFSVDSLNPAYRRTEDPFPIPADGSGVTRYDLRRPVLPPVAVGPTATADDIPSTRHFRKMAIYVKDGVILRVIERIEVTGAFADDFIDYTKRFLEEIEASDEVIEGFERAVAATPEEELSDFLLTNLNEGLAFSGVDPVDIRAMSFEVRDLGDGSIVADVPVDVIEGSLAILVNRGIKEATEQVGGDGSVASGSEASAGRSGGADGTDAGDSSGGEPPPDGSEPPPDEREPPPDGSDAEGDARTDGT